MASLLQNAESYFADQNGRPLVGGKVYFYFVGTENKKDTFKDSALTIPNTNPVILDARGNAIIWGTGTYRQVLTDANDVLIWDQIVAESGSTGAGNVTIDAFVPGDGIAAGTFAPNVTTALTLSRNYGSISNIQVFFDGTYQQTDQIASLIGPVLTFTSPIPAVSRVEVRGGLTVPIAVPATGSVTDAMIAPGSKLSNRINDYVDVRDFGAKGDTSVDDSVAINLALATVRVVYCPKGDYRLDHALNFVGGGGIVGDGERTFFQRNFTGGRLFSYPGGEPIYMLNFQIATAPTITVANGDTGIDIGYSTPWAGRGLIANLLIGGQWDAFKWKAGTGGSISNIQCIGNKGTGFYGTNPRMEFYDCLSQQNAGNGYHLYTEAGGESGVCFTRCGTFGNQGYGHLADAAAGFNAANLNWVSCTSSFDGQGGFFVASPTLQIAMTQILSEYSGYASNFNPAFTTNLAAVGIQINSGTYISGSDIQALNCAGAGILIDSCTSGTLGQVVTNGNGTGLLGGSNQCGFLFNNNNVDISVSGLIANTGGQQTTDIAFGTGNQVNLILPTFRTYNNSGSSLVQFLGRKTTATKTIASSAMLQLLDYCDVQTISGSTNINSISADTWPGRTITLIFQGTLTVSNAGNIKLTSAFSATPNSTLSLVTDGTNWYGK